MKVVIPTLESRISPRLDCAEKFLIIEVAEKDIQLRETWECDTDLPLTRVLSLAELPFDILICGAIDNCSQRILMGYGKQVIPWQSGTIDEVLQRWLSDQIGGMRSRGRMTRCGRHCRRE